MCFFCTLLANANRAAAQVSKERLAPLALMEASQGGERREAASNWTTPTGWPLADNCYDDDTPSLWVT